MHNPQTEVGEVGVGWPASGRDFEAGAKERKRHMYVKISQRPYTCALQSGREGRRNCNSHFGCQRWGPCHCGAPVVTVADSCDGDKGVLKLSLLNLFFFFFVAQGGL